MTSTVDSRRTAVLPRLVWSNLAAQTSEQVALAAAPLAAVLLLAAGPAETGWLQAIQTLPFLLLSLPAGVLADRLSRLRLIVGSELVRAGTLFGVLALAATGTLTLPALALLGFIGALGTVVYSVAAPALVPSVVPKAQLSAANRGLELARSVAYAAGPAVGGAVVAGTGVPGAYALAAALSLGAVVVLAQLAEPPRAPAPRRHMVSEMAEGARFVLRHDLLRPILFTAVIYNFSWFVLMGVFVAYAVQWLAMGPAQVGVTLGIYGGGMIAGALAAPMIARVLPLGLLIGIGPLSALVGSLLILATVIWPVPALTWAGFVLFGAGPILWTIATTTLRQTVTPNALLGRVSAMVMTATFGARPLGAASAALVAAHWGAGACLALAAAGFALQFVVIAASPVVRLTRLPEEDGALVQS